MIRLYCKFTIYLYNTYFTIEKLKTHIVIIIVGNLKINHYMYMM